VLGSVVARGRLPRGIAEWYRRCIRDVDVLEKDRHRKCSFVSQIRESSGGFSSIAHLFAKIAFMNLYIIQFPSRQHFVSHNLRAASYNNIVPSRQHCVSHN